MWNGEDGNVLPKLVSRSISWLSIGNDGVDGFFAGSLYVDVLDEYSFPTLSSDLWRYAGFTQA